LQDGLKREVEKIIKYSSDNQHILDFNKIKEILTDKYGKPEIDDKVWRRNLYRDDPTRYGFAVSIGDLVYRAKWITPRTEILLVLSGNNYKLKSGVIYTSLKYKDLIEAQEKKEHESEF